MNEKLQMDGLAGFAKDCEFHCIDEKAVYINKGDHGCSRFEKVHQFVGHRFRTIANGVIQDEDGTIFLFNDELPQPDIVIGQ